jgi:hypothetical protein
VGRPTEVDGELMPYTQQDLDKITKEIADGILEKRHGDNMKRSRSLDELLRIKAEIESALAAEQPPIRQVRMSTRSGV